MSLKDISNISNLRIKKHKGLSLLNVLEDIDRHEDRQKCSFNRMTSIVSNMKIRCLKKCSSLYSSESDSALFETTAKFEQRTLNSINSSEHLPTKDYGMHFTEPSSNNLYQDDFLTKCKISCSTKNIKNVKEKCCNEISQSSMVIYEQFKKQDDEDKIKMLLENLSLDSNNQKSLHIEGSPLPSQTSKMCEELVEIPQKECIILNVEPQNVNETNMSKMDKNKIEYGKENKGTYINLKHENLIESKEACSQFDGVPSNMCTKKQANSGHRRVKKGELQNRGIQAHRQSHHYLSPYHSPPYRFLFRPFIDPLSFRPPFPSDPSPNTSNLSTTKPFRFSSTEPASFHSNSVQILFPQNTRKRIKRKNQKKVVELNADQCKPCAVVKQNNIFKKLCCIATKTQEMFYSPRHNQKITDKTKCCKNSNSKCNFAEQCKDEEKVDKQLMCPSQFKYASTLVEESNINEINKQFASATTNVTQDNTVYYQQFVPNCSEGKNEKHKQIYKRPKEDFAQNSGNELSFEKTESNNVQLCWACKDNCQFNYKRPNYYVYNIVEDDSSYYNNNFIKLNSHLSPLQQNNYIKKRKLHKKPNFEVYNTGPYGANIFNEEQNTSEILKKNTIDQLIKLNESAKVTSGKKLSDFPELYEHIKKLKNVLDPTISSKPLKEP